MDLKELAKLVDEYIEVRTERRALESKADDLKTVREQPLRAKILEELKASKAGSVGGTKMQAALVVKKSYQATEWPLVRKFIIENDAWDLLQQRLSPPAIRERLEDGIEIPGLVVVDVDDLSITKL